MRRGHPGLGGWRGENPRHFRPRSGDSPHFRPPRNYQLHDSPRFPPGPGGRHLRGPRPYNAHPRHVNDRDPQDYHGRNNYRDVNLQNNPRIHERGHHPQPRSILPLIQHNARQINNDNSSMYREPPNFYDDVQAECHVNNLGDVDHRQLTSIPHNQDTYSHQKHPISPWANPPPLLDNKKRYYENRSPRKSYHHHEPTDGNTIPVLEYGGHRPPASDHYGGNLGPMVNNNNSFSRSVDDTVDIVRRRLKNRNDSQRSSEDTGGQSSNDQEVSESISQHTQEEPPAKKRIQRQRHNVKSNCDKMKSKIVHQLFKMDKDKMHKLMDNPSSSTKFEYAISSLITESQNSLNRHLRSVAEKSLYSSSTDFIHNDNNTIYEDTFMKQMQCLLDPQDTVLLEDIKPIVMAELSKVLQLEDLEQRFDGSENQGSHYQQDDPSNNSYYEPYNYDEYPQERYYDQDQKSVSNYDDPEKINTVEDNSNYEYNQETELIEAKPLFERRPVKNNEQNLERRQSLDNQRQRRSIDNLAEEKFRNEETVPLFDGNAEQFSEDEDPFAELDNQYHVAVDHNFITIDDISCEKNEIIDNIENDFITIKQQIQNQIQTIAQSPLKLNSKNSIDEKQQDIQVKSPDVAKEVSTPLVNPSHDIKLEQTDQRQEHATHHKETDKAEYSTTAKSSAPSHTRKRSIDQRPSHRKEKRKKSESSQPETNKHVSGKDTTNNASDTKSLNVDTFNVLVPKNDSCKEVLKDNKKIESADKGYSDKYVKRKETPKKTKEGETSKKRSSSSSSHSIVSPKDNNANINSQTPTKIDPKTKLKPIDMFVEQSKKVTVYHSHRNTAVTPTATEKKVEVNKNKVSPPEPVVIVRKPGKAVGRSVAVQVIKKLVAKTTQTFESKCVSTRFTQTDKKKFVSKLVQTEPVSLLNSTSKSNDAFERMKEIDLEIQVLLQEKFKLYSSLEAKDSCSSSMPTLGMTVLNVTPYDESKEDEVIDCDMSADAIVDEFTNIPVEELEQIALESVDSAQDEADNPKLGKRRAVQKLQQERRNSESPSTRRNKKAKAPNISLLEQIITDDRPLEDIISLDDLEKPLAKSKKRPLKSKSKKKVTKKTKTVKYNVPSGYELKECTVLLLRTDISTHLNQHHKVAEQAPSPLEPIVISDLKTEDVVKPTADPLAVSPPDDLHDVPPDASQEQPQAEPQALEPTELVVESVVNDLQFDMLDVSEDIVIGDSCEIKSSEDKEQGRVTISEEIILDNSQSSCDDAFTDPGQIESVCKTYDYSTDENLRRDSVTVSGHADAVLAIECIENEFIAACLDGNVYHFSGDGQLLNTLRGSNLAVTCLTIVKEKYETIVYTGSLDSRIRYYDLETGLEKGPECNVLSPIQTMDRAWDTIFVGTRTGFVLQFECKNNMLIPVSTVKFSEQSILALRALKEGPRKVLLVAARSENVTVKDAQTGLLLRTLVGPKMTVYTLLFEDGKVYCGTSSHQIHVFDYSSGTHTACHEGGKGAVCLRATGGLLFAGCYDGCVYVYREGEPRPLAQLRGPSLMLLSLAVVGSKIIAGYKDRSLYIWKIPLSILQEMIL